MTMVDDEAGWTDWQMSDPTRFNTLFGPFKVRLDSPTQARVRMYPEHRHSNLRNAVHGGAILAFVDVALFAASRSFGLITAGTAVTLDLSAQFIGEGRIGEPLDAEVELLRETGRMLFMRGLVVQRDHRVASFSGTIRKPTAR